MSGLYLVHLGTPLPEEAPFEAVKLDEGLYLMRSDQTRSRLYHAIKRQFDPERLLVAPLSDLPKFKGIRPGAATAARAFGARRR